MKKFLIFLFTILFLPFFSGAHYIVGIANDALDGTSANDFEVVLWNPSNGIDENLTDIIGVNGNSGTNNLYMIDCEMLDTPCQINDVLNVKIFSYPFSEEVSVTVTGAGYDIAENITLNSVPTTTPSFPVDFANVSSDPINFNCSFEDLDSNIESISLYGNWSGGWHLNETKSVSEGSGSVLFSKHLEEGFYEWGCFATDNLSVSSFSSVNFTVHVDRTPPTINLIEANESFICGTSDILRITCNTEDVFGINQVIIEAKMPDNNLVNYSASFLSGNNYYSDINPDLEGVWEFKCISFDYANNSNTLSLVGFNVYSDLPDLVIYQNINLSNGNPIEGEDIIISALILNNGCSNANNFLVGFYEDYPSFVEQIGDNKTISIQGLSNYSINTSWTSKIGPSNLFIFADVDDLITEFNETNNMLNRTIDVGAWQEFYGNVSGIKMLSDNLFKNFSLWDEDLNSTGNIFMTDMESDVDWLNLLAIGKAVNGENSLQDFYEIDFFLGTTDFKDSVENVFTNDGIPLFTREFFIHGKNVLEVPIINSTNNSVFFTGILWDKSDDSDGEYGLSDKEDIVFVAELNKGESGTYGVYDYELKVPVSLRSYDSANNKEIYFYYDLV